MNQDKEHLRLLAIFHYIVAGLAALFSFFPLLYATIGAIFIFVARHGTPKPGEELPPEFLGWIFVGLGSFLFLLGIAMAICILIAGRCLSDRKCHSFVLVMACIECLFINNSWRIHDYCAFARVREGVVFHSASAWLKLPLSKHRTPNAESLRKQASNIE